MTDKEITRASKYIALLLRHKPETAGLSLDANGWCRADLLVEAVARKYPGFTRQRLDEVVERNNKRRFAISDDGLMIRANQGHSIDVDVELCQATPPDMLYHGTSVDTVAAILAEGLTKQSRLHVHLSADPSTALAVGRRHGAPAILAIDTGRMASDGHTFYLSLNGVWLTDHVPPRYISQINNTNNTG